MKELKYYCDICNEELITNQVFHSIIGKIKFDFCEDCRDELMTHTLEYIESMKEIKEGDE